MDGRGRSIHKRVIERLWRSVKYEEVYLRDSTDGWQRHRWPRTSACNDEERIHQSLGSTAAEVYRDEIQAAGRHRDENELKLCDKLIAG